MTRRARPTRRDLLDAVVRFAHMIDFLFGLAVAAAIGRGYQRGVQREMYELVVLLVAIVVSFRLGRTGRGRLMSWAGVGDLTAWLVTGCVIFAAVVALGYFMAVLWRRRRGEPHVEWTHRLGGAVTAVVALAVASSVLVLIVAVMPLNEGSRRVLASSKVATSITADGSAPQRVVQLLGGTRIFESMLNLERFVEGEQVIVDPDDRVSLPEVGGAGVGRVHDEARDVFDLLNRARIEAGESPLSWSDPLADVAAAHAEEMYADGYFAHESPKTGSVADRVSSAGIPVIIVGENLALAATPALVHEGLMASPTHRSNMMEGRFRRVGIGAYEGPLGLLVVQVFTG